MKQICKSKKLWLLGAACFMTLAIGLTALYFLLPCQYVSIDVNPSIELKLNRLDHVVEIKGANEDARVLLQGYKAQNRKVNTVLAELTTLLIDQGYLAPNKSNNILVTMAEGASNETLENFCTQINTVVAERSMTAAIIGQVVPISPETLKASAQNEMSAGKLCIIERLIAADASLTPEELQQIGVGDLISYAGNAGMSLDMLEDYLDTAEDIFGDSAELDALEEALEAEKEALEKAEDAAEEAAEALEKAEDAAKEAAEAEKDAREQAEDAAEEAAEAEADAREQAAEDAKEVAEAEKEAAEKAADAAKELAESKKDAAEKAADSDEEDDDNFEEDDD